MAKNPDHGGKRSGAGRKTKLTPEVTERITTAVAAGNYLSTAVKYGGISYETFVQWRARGLAAKALGQAGKPIDDRELPYLDFLTALQEAEAESEVALVAAWRSHAPRDYRAARDLLARRHPDRWKERTEVVSAEELRVRLMDKAKEFGGDVEPG